MVDDMCQAQGTLSLLSLSSSHPLSHPVHHLLFFFSTGLATLRLPVYREIVRRSSISPSIALEAFASVAALVRRDALVTAMHMAECVRDVFALNLLTHIPWNAIEEWTQILLCEMEMAKGMGIDIRPNLTWWVSHLPL